MPNAVFVRHPVSFLSHHRPLPALVCRCRSTPSSSVAIAVRGSRRKPPQSSSPIRCLRRLLSLSLVVIVSCWVLFLPHRRPPPALACHCQSTPLSSVAIVVHGSRRKPPQSLSPVRCLRRLSLLSLIAVVSRWWPPTFQFILHHRRRRHHHRRFLLAVDIIAIYCPLAPCLLSLALLLVSCRASSQPPSRLFFGISPSE